MKPYISLSADWTPEQKDVWKNIEDHWACLTKGKVKEFLKFIHPQFIGYGHESPLPVDRSWLEHWVGFWAKSTTIPVYEIRPIHIVIHGDIAIVQYLIFTIEINDVDKGKRVIRRYTMTWQKQKDRWVVIGSHNNLIKEAV